MKKIYRFTKSGFVTQGNDKSKVKLLIQLSRKNPDKYRYILKIDDSIFNGWTIKKFSEENDPNINEKNIFLMDGFFQSLIIKLYNDHFQIDKIQQHFQENDITFPPIQWKWNYIKEDYLGIW